MTPANRRAARSNNFRAAHLGEKSTVVRRRGDQPETVDEFLARGGVIETLPAFAMSGNEVGDDEDE